MIPKFLSTVIDDFKIENVLTWLKEIIYFFIVPRRFYVNFYSKDYKQQIPQTVFYLAFTIFINWLLLGTGELKDVYRANLSMLFLTVPFVIANGTGLLLISQSKFDIWKVVSYLFILWTLYSVPIYFLAKMFATSENYTFYFLSNVLFTLNVLLSIFLFWHIVFQKVKHILFGYFWSILMFNLSLVIFSLLFVDTYSTSSSLDPIIEELTTNLENVKTYEGKPYTYVEETNPKIGYKNYKLGLLRNDTVFYYDKSHVDFYRNISKQNVNVIDSISQKLHFKRNKEIFGELSKYFKNISTYFDYPACDTCLIEHVVYRNKNDSTIVLDKKEFIIDEPYLKPYNNFEAKVNQLNELNDFATSPFYVYNVLISPVRYVTALFGFKEEEVNFNVQF